MCSSRSPAPHDRRSAPRALTCLGLGSLVALAALGPSVAHAEAPAVPAPPVKPAPAWAPKPKRPALPVKISVVASNPDPPWILRVENTSDTSIRVPADERLLSFELKPKPTSAVIQCKVPAAMAPKEFDGARELFLNAGESFTIAIDPRLYCFGSAIDKLIPGAVLTPTFGFSQFSTSKDAFVAQGLDRPQSYEPVRRVKGEAFTLPPIVDAATPPPQPTAGAAEPAAASPPDATAHADGAAHDHHAPDPKTKLSDGNAPALDLFVSDRVDAHAGRDVVLTLRAVNEGERKLAAVLRNRMLQLRVEALRADNQPRQVTVCPSQHAPHGVASELVTTLGAKGQSRLNLLVAEVCPPGTLNRPGLYRVRVELDSTVAGESLKADPWLAGALARQSALVRIATGREAFHAGQPSAGPVKLQRAAGANDNAAPPAHADDGHTPAHHEHHEEHGDATVRDEDG